MYRLLICSVHALLQQKTITREDLEIAEAAIWKRITLQDTIMLRLNAKLLTGRPRLLPGIFGSFSFA
jgi:hypothetical protein